MKQEILKTVQSLSSVSCRISGRPFYEAGTPKEHLTFRQVQQSSLCRYFMSSWGWGGGLVWLQYKHEDVSQALPYPLRSQMWWDVAWNSSISRRGQQKVRPRYLLVLSLSGKWTPRPEKDCAWKNKAERARRYLDPTCHKKRTHSSNSSSDSTCVP